MEENSRLVDVPAYARINKRGQYYAREKDMPYFADEKDVRGNLVIGEPTDIPGKMVPNWSYDLYCAPDAYEKKQAKIREKQEEEKRKAQEEEEYREKLKQTMGEEYLSLGEIEEEVHCYPLNGYLVEKFFRETGLSEILDGVFGPERAFLLKLSAAVIATRRPGFEWDGLNEYPMERHMRYDMDRFLNMDIWESVTEKEMTRVYQQWIKKVNPRNVASLAMDTKVTLYHDSYSDRYGDWFSSRIKTGTKYNHAIQMYRDEASGMLLAVEGLKYDHEHSYQQEYLSEKYTIQHSDYPKLRSASLHFFLPSYLFLAERAVKQMKASVWMHPSEYPDQKEMKKRLTALEKEEPESGYRILRWKGSWKETEGQWALVENPGRREWQAKEARNILNKHKKRLQAMSYYPASDDYMARYFDIEKEDDETDFFDSAPFTVTFVPKATEIFRNDAGRYLHFTTGEELDEKQLLRNLWCEEDLVFQYSAFINQGETTDVTDYYFDAMQGRELPLFLASMYREWIYDHIGDLFSEEYDVIPFAKEISRARCVIDSSGERQLENYSDRIKMLMERFDIDQKDVQVYISRVIRQKEYFSDKFRY